MELKTFLIKWHSWGNATAWVMKISQAFFLAQTAACSYIEHLNAQLRFRLIFWPYTQGWWYLYVLPVILHSTNAVQSSNTCRCHRFDSLDSSKDLKINLYFVFKQNFWFCNFWGGKRQTFSVLSVFLVQ